MEPILIAMGLATGLCIVFLVYGVWIAMRDGKCSEDKDAEHPTK